MDGLIALALAKNAINTSMGDIATNLTYKGSVESIEDLPSGASAGDMYGVGSEGLYVWNGTTWGAIGRKGPQGPKGDPGGTTDHQQLTNRDAANQHTIYSVTGLNEALSGKQATISDLESIRSGAQDGSDALQGVEDIEGLVPTQASTENQLADKDFVNSTLNSMSAFPISYNANGDGFPTISSLLNAQTYYSGGSTRVPTTNDYAFCTADTSKATQVSGYTSFMTTAQYVGYYVMYNDVSTLVTSDNKDSVGITAGTTIAYVAIPSTRYVYSVPDGQTSGTWNFQTVVTPLSFTAAQVKALNSGITAAVLAAINTALNDTETWTFTLDDDTTVTKTVVVKS